jgi:DNA-binding transcriptional ArsR family regulator
MVSGFDFRWHRRIGCPQRSKPYDSFLLRRSLRAGGESVHAFDVLGDRVRRRILELLATGEATAGSIVAVIQREFDISQAAVSQHLKVLRGSGFARLRIDGPRRVYSVNSAPLQDVDFWLDQFRGLWEQRLNALTAEIARGKRVRRRT